MSTNHRLHSSQLVASRFGFFRCLAALTLEQLERAASILVNIYPDDLDISFDGELIQFASFAKIFKDENQDCVMHQQSCSCINSLFENVSRTLSNVEVTLRMYSVLTISNYSGERSFSKLKLIKNRLRTSMTKINLSPCLVKV